jgi:UDP-glucose 4-epimerase
MRLWVIGAGGLFGSALVRQARNLGHQVTASTNIPWHDAQQARTQLRHEAKAFIDSGNGAIVWAAGKVTTASTDAEADAELRLFTDVVSDIAAISEHATNSGTFMLTSSAGGIYAGSTGAPFNAHSPSTPIGSYGTLKAAQEEIASSVLTPALGVLIARLANLYGPGQDLHKLQGLISRLALSSITREPLTMFVPLDTLRDYIYADDAAAIALHWLSKQSASTTTTRVIASGEPASLGHLIGLMSDITRTRIPVAYGIHASAAMQSPDLRLTPDTDEFTRETSRTSLPEGMKKVHLDLLQRHQQHLTRRGA